MKRFGIYLGLVLLAGFYLIPVYILVVTSFKPFGEVSLETMWNLPRGFDLSSFAQAWNGDPMTGTRGLGQNFWASLQMAIPATLGALILGSINGYVLAKWPFRYSNIIFALLLFGMFIPYQAILVPLVNTLQAIGIYGTIPGLILTHIVYGLPISTLIFRNFYADLPKELIDSGQVDGAGILGVYRHIVLPLSLPATVVVVIWQFTQIWNDFLFGVVVTANPESQPLTVALNNLAGSFVVPWNVQMAGALIAALPTLLIYIFMGRYFVQGLLAGSVKG
jgi:glucose/mannose transport system permease protein